MRCEVCSPEELERPDRSVRYKLVDRNGVTWFVCVHHAEERPGSTVEALPRR